jgi:hypothetical protein
MMQSIGFTGVEESESINRKLERRQRERLGMG